MITHEHERLDFTTIPQSKGIRTPAFIVLAVGLFGIFFMGWLSYWSSGYGHMWPAQKTMRMCLNGDASCKPGTQPQKTM